MDVDEPDFPVPVVEVPDTRMQAFLRQTKLTARSQCARLIGLCFICICSIACIACDKEKYFFTNIVTLIVGIVVNSPFDNNATEVPITRGGAGGGEGGGTPTTNYDIGTQVGGEDKIRVEDLD